MRDSERELVVEAAGEAADDDMRPPMQVIQPMRAMRGGVRIREYCMVSSLAFCLKGARLYVSD